MAAPPSERRSALSVRSARTCERILDAAGDCFAAVGFAKTTVDEVASRAGVSKALVYHYFTGKEAILDAVLQRTVAEWERLTIDELAAAEGSVLDRIAQMHRACMAYAGKAPVLRAILEFDPRILLGTGAGRAMKQSMERLRAVLENAIRAGVASGELRADLDAARVARVLLVTQLAFVEHSLDPAWVDVSDAALIETGLDILFRGLAGASR
jgi:AcrR family transcriptional regulator